MSTNSEMDVESGGSSSSDASLGVSGGGVRGRRGRRGGRRGHTGRRGSRPGGSRGERGHVDRGRGAVMHVRPAETQDERKERVKNLVSSLGEGRAKEILCLAVDRQPGLILDILDRIEPAQPSGFHPQPGGSSPSWCSCNNCRDMPTVEERVCCGYTPEYCLSQMPDIEMYIHVLEDGVLAKDCTEEKFWYTQMKGTYVKPTDMQPIGNSFCGSTEGLGKESE